MAIEKVETESDSDIFRSAMADEPEAVEQSEPKADATGRLHGQDGKYVPKANEAEAAPIQQQAEPTGESVQQEAQTKEDGQVPPWRMREMREERDAERQRTQDFERRLAQRDREFEALQRQFQQAQPKPEAPDFFANPDAAIDHRLNPIETQFNQLAQQRQQWEQSQQPKPEAPDFFANPDAAIDHRLNPIETQFNQLASKLVLRASKAEAYAEHGVAVVKEMEQAIGKAMQEQHPDMRALSAEMRNSDDPVGVAMNWYKRDKLLKETGGDIAGYRSKLEGDLLKDPAFLAKALDAARAQAGQPGKQSTVQIPPSLNKAAGGSGNEAEKGDMSDASLWAESRPTGRRK